MDFLVGMIKSIWEGYSMSTQEINDLAFKFVNSGILLTSELIKSYFFEAGGKLEELDYFLVFVKHWLDNQRNLEWSDIIMGISRG